MTRNGEVWASPEGKTRPTRDSDIARMRRDQIVEAAVDIIVTQGLPKLSLSLIEERTSMKRGQLTYYFPFKEDILLAVFDRLLELMLRQIGEADGVDHSDCLNARGVAEVWEMTRKMLGHVLGPKGGMATPEFFALEYTFLAQMAHREDFRAKLAGSYEEWRMGLGGHWAVSARPTVRLRSGLTPRTVASFMQAVVHGLTVQLAADPKAFDRAEMLELCLAVLAPLYVGGDSPPVRVDHPGFEGDEHGR